MTKEYDYLYLLRASDRIRMIVVLVRSTNKVASGGVVEVAGHHSNQPQKRSAIGLLQNEM